MEQFHFIYQQYHNGIPIFRSEPALSLSLSSRAVSSYQRRIITPLYPAENILALGEPEDFLEDVYLYLQSGNTEEEEKIMITDLFPAYDGYREQGRETILDPIWVIETAAGERLSIDTLANKIQTLPPRGREKEDLPWTGTGPRTS